MSIVFTVERREQAYSPFNFYVVDTIFPELPV